MEFDLAYDRTQQTAAVSETLSRAEKLAAIVEGLKLNDPSKPFNKDGSDDFSVAQHEEDTRSIILWAELRPFLTAYAPAFPQEGLVLSGEELKEAISVALNEPEFLLSQYLIKAYLRGEKPLTLGMLAEKRYVRGTASWDKYKSTLAREIFDSMRDLQLWTVNTIGRDDNGGGAIAGYEISAGPSLIDFDKYVFQPTRTEISRRFYVKFMSQMMARSS